MKLIWIVSKVVAEGSFVDVKCNIKDCNVFHNAFTFTLTKEQYLIIGRPTVGETLAITMECLD